MFQLVPAEFDVGLLSGLKNLGKSVLKVIDNPVTRTVLGSAGLSTVGGLLSSAAGNQAAANAQLGAGFGATYSAGAPVYTPQITGAPMMIGNTLFPSIPSVGQVVGRTAVAAGVWPAGYQPRKRRRMNPANIQAARRAIRRIRSTRRVLQRIERLLPTRTVHSRRAK